MILFLVCATLYLNAMKPTSKLRPTPKINRNNLKLRLHLNKNKTHQSAKKKEQSLLSSTDLLDISVSLFYWTAYQRLTYWTNVSLATRRINQHKNDIRNIKTLTVFCLYFLNVLCGTPYCVIFITY